MDIKDIRIKKRNAEMDMLAIVNEFNMSTGLTIDSVDVTSPYAVMDLSGNVIAWSSANLSLRVAFKN